MRFAVLLLFFVFILDGYSQLSLESSYNAVYNGRNVNLSVKQNFKNLALSVGLKYHINRPEMVPYGSFFKNSATATNFAEHIGFQIGVDYFFYRSDFCKIGAYYNNQFSRMSETFIFYSALDQLVPVPQSEFDYSFTKFEKLYGPVIAFDNTIGLAMEVNLSKRIYTMLRGGFGMMFWKNTDSSFIIAANTFFQHGYNFTSFGSVGFGYKFAKREKKEKGKS
ncbi:MAG: hypothetical protein WC044_00490 [Crocinitomicaceae bacterium]